MTYNYHEALKMRNKIQNERNQKILARWAHRIPLHKIGAEFGITKQRVSQIVARYRKAETKKPSL